MVRTHFVSFHALLPMCLNWEYSVYANSQILIRSKKTTCNLFVAYLVRNQPMCAHREVFLSISIFQRVASSHHWLTDVLTTHTVHSIRIIFSLWSGRTQHSNSQNRWTASMVAAQCVTEWKKCCGKQNTQKMLHTICRWHAGQAAADADGTDNAMMMTDEATIIRRRRPRLAVMGRMELTHTARLSTAGYYNFMAVIQFNRLMNNR